MYDKARIIHVNLECLLSLREDLVEGSFADELSFARRACFLLLLQPTLQASLAKQVAALRRHRIALGARLKADWALDVRSWLFDAFHVVKAWFLDFRSATSTR